MAAPAQHFPGQAPAQNFPGQGPAQHFPGQAPANPGDNPVYHPHAGPYGAPVQARQPQPQEPMMPAQQPAPPPQTSDWNAGLCGCCSPFSSCLLACCAPCIINGRTADRMKDPTMQSADTFNNDCLISFVLNCFVGCGWIWTMQQRGQIRRKYGIKGSSTNDCCVAYWCPCCSTVQNDKEVVSRTKGVVATGYTPQAPMKAQ